MMLKILVNLFLRKQCTGILLWIGRILDIFVQRMVFMVYFATDFIDTDER